MGPSHVPCLEFTEFLGCVKLSITSGTRIRCCGEQHSVVAQPSFHGHVEPGEQPEMYC